MSRLGLRNAANIYPSGACTSKTWRSSISQERVHRTALVMNIIDTPAMRSWARLRRMIWGFRWFRPIPVCVCIRQCNAYCADSYIPAIQLPRKIQIVWRLKLEYRWPLHCRRYISRCSHSSDNLEKLLVLDETFYVRNVAWSNTDLRIAALVKAFTSTQPQVSDLNCSRELG